MSIKHKKNRLFYIDFIRVISFLAIVFSHFNYEIFTNYQGDRAISELSYAGYSISDIAISLFIIISGFSLAVSSDDKLNIMRFFKHRILSIYPAFWTAYIIVAIFFFITNSGFVGDGNHWKFILSIIGLDGYFLYKMSNYYLIGEWYTGFMLLTYLFFPILFLLAIKYPKSTFITLIVIVLSLSVNYNNTFQVPIVCNPIMRLPEFFFGILYGYYFSKTKKIHRLLFIFGVIIIYIMITFLQDKLSFLFYILFFGCSTFSILVFISQPFDNISLIKELINFISKYCFTAFLFHHQILFFLFHKINFYALNFGEIIFFYIIIVIFSLFTAKLCDPLIKKIRHFISKWLKLY
ncbi:acyltransferase (plasmid) [Arsenophonus sp. aPb]|uniref:acyltransferase family protein n=1 Tax=Arsenophonus sp. aPb TaxID=3041619 RepID=UPI00246993A5|nr:acyltransferase [Arsenophonus sp. aPb]WGL99914.1 acyltransferase [Arsenophonus sp. aPb]